MAAAVIAAAAATLVAAAAPAVHPESKVVSAGDAYTLVGRGWPVSSLCEPRIHISQTFGHGVRVGSARIDPDGTFAFTRRIRRSTPAGTRLVLDATQYCRDTADSGATGTTRSATVRVARPAHGCPYPLTVRGRSYEVTVHGRLGCGGGGNAIGAFLAARIEPDGFLCALTDPRTGHDAVCVGAGDPAARVEARRVREV